MKALLAPAWLRTGVLARYHSGASHLFLLHGNVRDVQAIGADYLPLADGLRRLAGRRAVLVSYHVSQGLAFPHPAREKGVREVLPLQARPPPAAPARPPVLPHP